MKLATLSLDTKSTVVVVDPERSTYRPVTSAFPDLQNGTAADMVSVIEGLAGGHAKPKLNGGGATYRGDQLLTPIAKPTQNILCVGKNYNAQAQVKDGISIESHVADLAEVVASVGASNPVHLAGHSMGTIVCQHSAAAHPELVTSLVLA